MPCHDAHSCYSSEWSQDGMHVQAALQSIYAYIYMHGSLLKKASRRHQAITIMMGPPTKEAACSVVLVLLGLGQQPVPGNITLLGVSLCLAVLYIYNMYVVAFPGILCSSKCYVYTSTHQ